PDVAARVDAGEVAGGVPTVAQNLGGTLRVAPVAEHHVRPLDQQLAILAQPHLHVPERLAHAAGRRAAIARAAGDDGRAFTGAVALDDAHAETLPERLRLYRQRRAARGHHAQLSADASVHEEEEPPPRRQRQTRRRGE